MKCHDFDTICVDLARDGIMEAGERESAVAHADSCSQCARKLANQRTLTAGLRRLAEASQKNEAPAGVAIALQAAFREQLRTRAAAITAADSRRPQWRRRAWAAAAAIAVLFAAGFIAWRIDRIAPGDEPTQAGGSQPNQQGGSDPAAPKPEERKPLIGQTKTPPVHKPWRKTPAPRTRSQIAQPDRPADNPRRPVQNVEIATDFIPVSGSELMPLDEGLVVRIELPRSALVSFGLPMNIERADERIKADVVLGNDGLARAIRFVH
jgi:hypothetical protein